MDFDPELIVIQAASAEHDILMIEGLMDEVLRLVHVEDSAAHMGSAE